MALLPGGPFMYRRGADGAVHRHRPTRRCRAGYGQGLLINRHSRPAIGPEAALRPPLLAHSDSSRRRSGVCWPADHTCAFPISSGRARPANSGRQLVFAGGKAVHNLSRHQAEGPRFGRASNGRQAQKRPRYNVVRSFKQAWLPPLAFRSPTGSFRAPGASATCQ